MSLAHLHVHTGYSLLDSMIRINELVDSVKEMGMNACAITDHGTLAGAVKFTEACIKAGIKPIIGQEFYIAPDSRHRKKYAKGEHSASHLILIAKDDIGWKNLMALSTKAYTEGFYRKPRIDHALLLEHREGLIATSACIGGDIAIHLQRGLDAEGEGKVEYDPLRAAAKAAWYFNHFGDDFYLEMQAHGDETHERVSQWYRDRYPASQLIATADCHYLKQSDWDTHDTLLCAGTYSFKGDPTRWRFPTQQCYLKSEADMLGDFSPDEIENTQRVADKVTFELPLRKQFFMPEIPEDVTRGDAVARFKEECYAGLGQRCWTSFGTIVDEGTTPTDPFYPYIQRLEYEMDVFIKAGFVEYALLLWDLMQFCKANDIFTGDGRGSGAGSLVLYSLGITNVDPIARDCPFERFINAGRLERFAPPDVDLDFPQLRRAEVIDYLKARYGEERVCQIGTYATLGPAALIRKLQVPLGIDPSTVNKLCTVIPGGEGSLQGAGAAGEIFGLTLDDIYMQVDSFRQTIDVMGDTGKWLLHYARGLQKLGTHASKHASGVIITNQNVSNLLPLMRLDGSGAIMAQFDMFDSELLGLIKFDILGLKALDTLHYIEKMIKENDDAGFSFDAVDLDDPAPYALLHQGRTVGIFQAEGGGFGRLLPQTKPTTVEELAALTSLCRPGPSISGLTETYVRRKNGSESVEYSIPILESVLARSYGVLCFQEDIMNIAHRFAGFTLAEADDLRKVMGKKQRDKVAAMRPKFLNGLEEHSGVSPNLGEKLWQEIAAMAEYVFNRSHAMAYSYTTAKCMWAKWYYPAYFMAATMTSEIRGDGKEMPSCLNDCRFLGVTLVPPDVNASEQEYSAIDRSTIRVGLLGVHQVGEKAVSAILTERAANGPFKDKEDFRNRLPARAVNKTVMNALENAGAFDALDGRKRLITTERLLEEFALFGFFLSGHPLQRMRTTWDQQIDDLVTLNDLLLDYEREQAFVYTGNGRRRAWVFPERHIRAIVTRIEQKKSKRDGKIMLFVDIEDETASCKMILHQGALAKFGNPSITKGVILDLHCRKSDPERWAGYVEPTNLMLL